VPVGSSAKEELGCGVSCWVDQSPTATGPSRRDALFLVLVFLVSLGWSVHRETVGWHHTISGAFQNGFRQSQTALSTVYLARGGPLLAYETPVVGPPWSIPFEFPLYQYIVATAVRTLHTALIPTGRFISVLFLYATLCTVWHLLGELAVARPHRLVFLTLLITSPLYVFWSRCFMIESTALFLATAQLYFVIRGLRVRTLAPVICAWAMGTLAALVKPTTWMPFAALAGLMVAVQAYRGGKGRMPRVSVERIALLGCATAVLPAVALAGWTEYADLVKSHNPIGSVMRSNSPIIVRHLYGTLAQRFDWETWSIMADRTIPDITGRRAGFLLPLLALCVTRERVGYYIAALGAFVLPIVAFANLHVVHNYYAYANGLFLLVGSGWAIEGLFRANTRWWLPHVALLACAGIAVYGYYDPGVRHDYRLYSGSRFSGYASEQDRNDRYAQRLGVIIRSAIPSDSIVVGVGLDWSSELPLYAERRALMIPNWIRRDPETGTIEQALAQLPPGEVGALVECPGNSRDHAFVVQLAERLRLDRVPRVAEWCLLFTRSARGR